MLHVKKIPFKKILRFFVFPLIYNLNSLKYNVLCAHI